MAKEEVELPLLHPLISRSTPPPPPAVMAKQEAELQLPGTSAEVVVNVDKLKVLSSLKARLQVNKPKPECEEACTIYRVRDKIRKEDPGAYDPQILSIGPFHRGKNQALLPMELLEIRKEDPEAYDPQIIPLHRGKYQALLPMELLKPHFLRDLISRHDTNSLDMFVDGVSTDLFLAKVSNCYSEPVIGPDSGQDFVEMMVLDGCFIIEFLVKSLKGEEMNDLDAGNRNRSLVENDLLLLENQMPFFVLETLFESCIIPGIHDTTPPTSAKDLAMCFFSRVKIPPPMPNVVHHLLHLRHLSLTPTEPKLKDFTKCSCTFMCVMRLIFNKFLEVLSVAFFWVLSLVLNCGLPSPSPAPSERAPRMTLTATGLDEAGVKFKTKKNANSYLDVSFKHGTILIPMISIQAETVSQFRNLVALEQCCPFFGNYFTSYVALMDNLIDKPEDVAILKHNGILESKLSSDEDVTRFFNSLGKGAYLNYEKHYLVGLFTKMKDYCGTRRHRWRARLVHDYFSNPWSIFSVIAAVVLLLLTVLQTTYAVLAYVKPPKS